MENNKEIRSFTAELRAVDTESRKVEGYAALFDTWSNNLGGFIEKIERGAFTEAIANSDVLCVLNHNDERGVLARWTNGAGSLQLFEDEKGLRYSFDAPNTQLGDELLEGLRRGDIRESSFAFTIDADEWDFSNEQEAKRTIKKVKRLYDVSPVYFPAYNGTYVNQRMAEHRKAIEDKEKKKAEDLEAYYNQF